MLRVAVLVLFSVFAASLLHSQVLLPKEQSLLLPNEEVVSGVVVDSSGRPIDGAVVENIEPRNKVVMTDATGHFSLSTRAPSFVICKTGYTGAFVRTSSAPLINITLDRAHGMVKSCENMPPCKSIDGFAGIFCLPRLKGVKVSKQGNDADYGQRFFSVPSKDGVKSIWHGSGPMWGPGIPSNENVWRSVEYSEQSFLWLAMSSWMPVVKRRMVDSGAMSVCGARPLPMMMSIGKQPTNSIRCSMECASSKK